jgi:CheY-like chemotaxis protein
VNEIIEHVQRLLYRLIGEDVELKISLSAGPLTAVVDSVQIEQILMNLATNARDAMPDGGELLIGTSVVTWTDEYIKQQGYGAKGDYVCITVSDTGTGMDENTRQKVFEPFFTTKELGRGTGLGLAMVYGIVKQHDGYVNVQSKIDEGTTFEIFFPMGRARTSAAAVTVVGENVRGGTETILIAEDDEEIRQTTRVLLEMHGYQVVEALDGDDALNKYMELSDSIDLLILDVIMPRKNGKQVYDEIRRNGHGVKALFFSGYPAGIIGRKGILEEDLHFMKKPVSPKDFLRRIRTTLDS